MASFVLRKVDSDLWRAAREKAKRDGVSLVPMIQSWLVAWLKQDADTGRDEEWRMSRRLED